MPPINKSGMQQLKDTGQELVVQLDYIRMQGPWCRFCRSITSTKDFTILHHTHSLPTDHASDPQTCNSCQDTCQKFM